MQLILRLHDSPDFLRIFSAFPEFLLEHMTSQLYCYLIGWFLLVYGLLVIGLSQISSFFSIHIFFQITDGETEDQSVHSLTVHNCVIYLNFCHTKTYSQWLEQQWYDSAQWWLMSYSNLSEYWKFKFSLNLLCQYMHCMVAACACNK